MFVVRLDIYIRYRIPDQGVGIFTTDTIDDAIAGKHDNVTKNTKQTLIPSFHI
jgi:hypothetical protein